MSLRWFFCDAKKRSLNEPIGEVVADRGRDSDNNANDNNMGYSDEYRQRNVRN